MSSSNNIVSKHEPISHMDIPSDSEGYDIKRDKNKIKRIRSHDSLDTVDYDVTESNILSSLFDGIPFNINSKPDQHELKSPKLKMQCVNVIQRAKQRCNAIVMATGLREPDEMRIIFKQRPLGIQIKPVNIHGFGAKISKITNNSVYQQGAEDNMIITGLNNKDLLGCTFDQIMTIIKAADLPITLRVKKRSNILPQMNTLQMNDITRSTYSCSSMTSTSTRSRRFTFGPQRDKTPTTDQMLSTMYDINSSEPPSLTPNHNLMLASFSVENMPVSTVLSSSSDEDNDGYTIQKAINEEEVMDSDVDTIEDQEDEYGMSYVQWNNIRLGASVIKYGWLLDIDNDEDETTFELAYDTLTRQGLNIYEIRAAIRLIREQPEQIPPLDTFKHLTIHNKRAINSSINPKFMPQQWLKETNLNIDIDDDDLSLSTTDDDADDEEEYDEAHNDDDGEAEDSEYSATASLSSGPSTTSLQNELQRMNNNMNSNNIYFNTFLNHKDNEFSPTPNKFVSNSIHTPIPDIINDTQRLHQYVADDDDVEGVSSRYRHNEKVYVSTSYKDEGSVALNGQGNHEYRLPKQPISGYIDFFDDNESSTESESSSQSIELQQAMDVIGLKSPDFDNMAALYSTDDDEEHAMDNTNTHPFGLIKNADGELFVMDRRGHIVDTPDYVDDHDVEYAEYSSDGIGISSYMCTEGADDLLDNECLPQVMLKYVVPREEQEEEDTMSDLPKDKSKEKERSGFNFLYHLKNITKKDENNNKFLGLKNSIRGLSIKTNMKSIFKMKVSPGNTPMDK